MFAGDSIQPAVITLDKDHDIMHKFCKIWLVTLNPNKTVFMFFSSKMSPSLVPQIYYGNIRLQWVQSHKHLGLILTPNLSSPKDISAAIANANRCLEVLKRYKYTYSRKYLEIGYICKTYLIIL